jgi:hypothetical protein
VPVGTYIAKIELSYTSYGLMHFRATTDKNISFERGRKLTSTRTYSQTFDEQSPFVGFAGYEGSVAMALGFYSFKCILEGTKQWTGETNTDDEDSTEDDTPIFDDEEEEETEKETDGDEGAE